MTFLQNATNPKLLETSLLNSLFLPQKPLILHPFTSSNAGHGERDANHHVSVHHGHVPVHHHDADAAGAGRLCGAGPVRAGARDPDAHIRTEQYTARTCYW